MIMNDSARNGLRAYVHDKWMMLLTFGKDHRVHFLECEGTQAVVRSLAIVVIPQLDSAQLGALALDDNDYPKQIWSFLFRGKKFSKFGPEGYSLAHLADHKEYNNRFAQDFEVAELESRNRFLYGLYTCPTNTVYIPSSLIKPTDFAGTIRGLLMRRAEDLYGGFCNLLPDFLRIPKSVFPGMDN